MRELIDGALSDDSTWHALSFDGYVPDIPIAQ